MWLPVLQGCPESSMENTTSRLRVKDQILGDTFPGHENDSQHW